jgi:hypothetical protein
MQKTRNYFCGFSIFSVSYTILNSVILALASAMTVAAMISIDKLEVIG